jgi:hypothetical protein
VNNIFVAVAPIFQTSKTQWPGSSFLAVDVTLLTLIDHISVQKDEDSVVDLDPDTDQDPRGSASF